MQGYLASATFNRLALQSGGACLQQRPAAYSANNTGFELISPPSGLKVFIYHTDSSLSIHIAKAHTLAKSPDSSLRVRNDAFFWERLHRVFRASRPDCRQFPDPVASRLIVAAGAMT